MVRVATKLSLLLLGIALTGCAGRSAQAPSPGALPVPSWAGGAHLTDDERADLQARRPLFDEMRTIARHRAKGDTYKAFRLARTLVIQHPEFVPGVQHYLELAAETDNVQEAVTLFTHRIEKDRSDGAAWYALSLMRDGEGQIEYGKKAVEAGCDSWSCYVSLATAFAHGQRVNEGIDWFRHQEGVAGAGTDQVVYARLAEAELLRYGSGTPDAVEKILLEVVSMARAGHGWEVGLKRLGMLYASLGRYLDAREALKLAYAVQQAMGNWEGELSVLFNQVLLEREAGYLKVAAGIAEQARDLATDCGDLWYMARFLGLLGDLRMTLEDPRGAIDCYEPEVVLDRKVGNLSRLPIAWAHLGLAYRATGRQDEAIQAFKKARGLFQSQGEMRGVNWVDGLLSGSGGPGQAPASPPSAGE